MTNKIYSIVHSNGITERLPEGSTYADALAAVRETYTDPEIGHDGDIADGGDTTLVWRDEASARDDDGCFAVCSIRVSHPEPPGRDDQSDMPEFMPVHGQGYVRRA
jgi:hypothetical protein